MANTYLYNIMSPNGDKFVGIESLKKFCEDHKLNYNGFKKSCIKNRNYKKWIINKYEKPDIEYDKLKQYGLSTEERLNRAIDENSKLKSAIKDYEREDSLFKYASGVIKETTPHIQLTPFIKSDKKSKINENAILLLSDLHADQEIYPNRVRNLEEYNFDVACKRAEKIVYTTIDHLINNMNNYNFDKLYIFGLGDYVNGDIHNATEHSKWKNSIKNAMATGELLAQMIKELSKYFPEIVFVSVSGNHGRFTRKKDYRGALNNWDYLVSSYAVSRLQQYIDDGRVNYIIPDAWSVGVKIYDWNFILNHGDDIKSFNSLPYYGIERKTRRLSSIGALNNNIPHYFMYGHFHHVMTQSHVTGEVFINGSWNATDEFALESLGAYSEPTQLLLGCHEKYGITWRMPIKLRDENWRETEKQESKYKNFVI